MIETAVEILRSERDAINAVANNLGEAFVEAIEILRNCKGQVVLSGVGKSYLIAQKISASMASTEPLPFHCIRWTRCMGI